MTVTSEAKLLMRVQQHQEANVRLVQQLLQEMVLTAQLSEINRKLEDRLAAITGEAELAEAVVTTLLMEGNDE